MPQKGKTLDKGVLYLALYNEIFMYFELKL